jgi:hypothetical protein
VPDAAGTFVSAVETAVQNHDVSPAAGQAIEAPVTQLLSQYSQLGAAQISQQLQQIAQAIGADVQQGQLTGTAVTSVEDGLSQLAKAMGDTTALSFSAPAPPAGGGPGGGGHGHGHGKGNGNNQGG